MGDRTYWPNDFKMFGGKLHKKMLFEEWPNQITEGKRMFQASKSTQALTYPLLLDFLRNLILAPAEYGFANSTYATDNTIERVLMPFFFPGLSKGQLAVGPITTAITAWQGLRFHSFKEACKDYEKFDPLKDAPTEIPDQVNILWAFRNYNPPKHNFAYRVVAPVEVPFPGRNGPLTGETPLRIMDIGAALGYIFSIHPLPEKVSGDTLFNKLTLKEKMDAYYFPAALFYAAMLKGTPFSVGMSCVMVRDSTVDDDLHGGPDCLEAFFSSTIAGGELTQIDLSKSTYVPFGRNVTFRNNNETLKDLVTAGRFLMLHEGFGLLKSSFSELFKHQSTFPPVWPLRELHHAEMMAKCITDDLAEGLNKDLVIAESAPASQPAQDLLKEAEDVRIKFMHKPPPPPKFEQAFKIISQFHPLMNSRVFNSKNVKGNRDASKVKDYTWPLHHIFRSKALRYTAIDLIGIGVMRMEDDIDIKAWSEKKAVPPDELQNYQAQLNRAVDLLLDYREPIRSKDGPTNEDPFVFELPNVEGSDPIPFKPVKAKFADDAEPKTKLKTFVTERFPRVPANLSDYNNDKPDENAKSVQGLLYKAHSKVPPQMWGQCAETYPIIYFARASAKYKHELKRPFALTGISVKPTDAVIQAYTKNTDAEKFTYAGFAKGRLCYNAHATHADHQLDHAFLIDDPCHNCKGLLRLFKFNDLDSPPGDGLKFYDGYVSSMREVRTGVNTYTEFLPETERGEMFYPRALKESSASWGSETEQTTYYVSRQSKPNTTERTRWPDPYRLN